MVYIKRFAITLLAAQTALAPMAGWALPQQGTVTSGSASIEQDGNQLTINQSSQKAILNWNSFDIDAHEAVHFNQPNAQATALNRINSNNPSHILGVLTADGQVFLLNPNGVIFGQGSQVDVGGLLATSANITDADFLADKLEFLQSGNPDAIVANHGDITVKEGGMVALVAPGVENSGVINARLGKVALISANTYAVDLYGDGLIQLAVGDKHTADTDLGARVNHTGTTNAEGGMIQIAASEAAQALNNLVNLEGYLGANSVDAGKGTIKIGAAQSNGRLRVAGTVEATGNSVNQFGGTIEATGNEIILTSTANVSANGTAGGGIIKIGGDHKGQGDMLRSARLGVAQGAEITADATDNGNGGYIVFWADDLTNFAGHASARGGDNGGDGGFIEVSAKDDLRMRGTADTQAPQGETGLLLLDPDDITVVDGAIAQPHDGQLGDDEILAADGAGTYTISEGALEALGAATNVTLEANNNITIQNLTDDELSMAQGTGFNVVFTADADVSGAGDFIMDSTDDITTAGANVTINGDNITVGGINTSTGVGTIDLTTHSGTGVVTLYDNLTTNTADITIAGNTTLGAGLVASTSGGGGAITFNGTVNGAQTFSTVGGTGDVTLNGAVGGSTPLTSINVTGENITLADVGTVGTQVYNANTAIGLSGILTTSGAKVDLQTATILSGNSSISTSGGDIDLDSTVDGGFNLILSAGAGTITNGGNLGLSTRLANFSATGDTINTNAIFATGDINGTATTALNLTGSLNTNGGAITLGGPTVINGTRTLTSGGAVGNDITLNGAVTGNFTMNLVAGSADIYTTSLDIDTLTLTSGDDYTVDGTIITDAALDFTNIDDITLSADTSISSDNGAGGYFDITLDADNTITGGGNNLTITGATVGLYGITGVDQLDVTGNTAIVLNNAVSTDGTQDYTGNTTLSGDLTTTNDDITITGTTTLAADTQISTGAGAGDIQLTANVNGGQALTTDAGTGAVTMGGQIGNSSALTSYTANGNTVAVNNVITSGAQDYTGTTTLNGDLTTTNNNIDFNSAVALGADVNLSTGAGGGNITFNSTVNNGQALAADAGAGVVTFSSAVGGGTALTSMDIDGATITLAANATTTGAQNYTGATTLSGDLTTTTGDIDFNSGLTISGASNLDSTSGNVDINSTLTLNDNLSGSNTNGDYTVAGAIDGTGNLNFSTTNGDININSTVDNSGDITLSAAGGTVTLAAAVGATTDPNSIDIDATTISTQQIETVNNTDLNGTNITLGGDITSSSGDVRLTGDVTLPADRTLTSGGTNADDIVLNITVDDDRQLILNTGVSGDIQLTGTYDIDNLSLTGDDVTLNANITTDNPLDFTSIDDITLSGATQLTANDGATAQNIVFDAANTITGNQNLTMSGDTVTLYRINGVDQLNVTGATGITINDQIDTNGTQTYTGATTLSNNIGTTNDTITFNNALTIGAGAQIDTDTGAGNIVFNSTVDGANTLSLAAGTGTITAGGTIGGGTPLTSLTVTSSGGTGLTNVTTSGAQAYTGDVTLNGTLTSTGDSITLNDALTLTGNSAVTGGGAAGNNLTFTGDITGDYTLNLTAASGNINLANADVDTLTFTSGDSLNLGGDLLTDTTLDFSALGNFLLTANSTINANNGTGNIVFDSSNAINGGGFTLGITGDTLDLYAMTNLSGLTINATTGSTVNNALTIGGPTIFNGATTLLADVTATNSNLTFNDAITLTGDTQLSTSAGGGTLTLGGLVDGGANLTLVGGTGSIVTTAALGVVTPLTSLTATAATLNFSGVRTTGDQSYTGTTTIGGNFQTTNSDILFNSAATLSAATTLNTGIAGGDISFIGTLDGTQDMTITAGTGNFSTGGAAGLTTRLGAVTINTVDSIILGNAFQAQSFNQIDGTGITNFGNIGINVSGGLSINGPTDISGRIDKAGDVVLVAANTINGYIDATSLQLTAQTSNQTGRLRSLTGRRAAAEVVLVSPRSGPYIFNGFLLPLVDSNQTYGTLQSGGYSLASGTPRVTVNIDTAAARGLNPVRGDYQLLVPARGAEESYESFPYMTEDLWQYLEQRRADQQLSGDLISSN